MDPTPTSSGSGVGPSASSSAGGMQPLTPFQRLSVTAVVFSSLSALFGVFCVLFILAVWSTYRHRSRAYARLRTVTIVLFFVLLTHYLSHALILGQERGVNLADVNVVKSSDPVRLMKSVQVTRTFTIPLVFIGGFASTIAGYITDSLLVWRFYVIYGRSKWALCVPGITVTLTALLGFSGNFLNFAIYREPKTVINPLQMVSYQVNAGWAWCMFATNTVLTGAIIAKIIYTTRRAKAENAADPTRGHYHTILEAIAESSLVTWIGLLLYGVACVAPHGHITTNWDIGYVMLEILPIFFGISQCLLTARLGFATSMASASYFIPDLNDGEIRITIQKETMVDIAESIDEHSGMIPESEDTLKITRVESV